MTKSKKSIDTLVPDIYNLFEMPRDPDPENVKVLLKEIEEAVLSCMKPEARVATLRFSNMGKPDRQLWYELVYGPIVAKTSVQQSTFKPSDFIKFMFGHVIEALVVFMAKEAGHEVKYQQQEVFIHGIKGHTDGVIDGVVVDVKSASTFSFMKFDKSEVLSDCGTKDPFGYIGQISGYHEALCKMFPDEIDPNQAAFIVMDKQHGTLTVMKVDKDFDMINAEERILHLKEVLSQPEPPKEKCYPEVEHDNGNKEIHNNCNWCPFKEVCWKDANEGKGLRVFKYSNKWKFFSHVEKEPRVEEIFLKPKG